MVTFLTRGLPSEDPTRFPPSIKVLLGLQGQAYHHAMNWCTPGINDKGQPVQRASGGLLDTLRMIDAGWRGTGLIKRKTLRRSMIALEEAMTLTKLGATAGDTQPNYGRPLLGAYLMSSYELDKFGDNLGYVRLHGERDGDFHRRICKSLNARDIHLVV